jgi:hypothetical protein
VLDEPMLGWYLKLLKDRERRMERMRASKRRSELQLLTGDALVSCCCEGRNFLSMALEYLISLFGCVVARTSYSMITR